MSLLTNNVGNIKKNRRHFCRCFNNTPTIPVMPLPHGSHNNNNNSVLDIHSSAGSTSDYKVLLV